MPKRPKNVETVIIKKGQEDYKFNAISDSIEGLLVKLEDTNDNTLNISDAMIDNVNQLEVCFKSCQEVNYQMLLLDPEAQSQENEWFSEKSRLYNELRLKCKIMMPETGGRKVIFT